MSLDPSFWSAARAAKVAPSRSPISPTLFTPGTFSFKVRIAQPISDRNVSTSPSSKFPSLSPFPLKSNRRTGSPLRPESFLRERVTEDVRDSTRLHLRFVENSEKAVGSVAEKKWDFVLHVESGKLTRFPVQCRDQLIQGAYVNDPFLLSYGKIPHRDQIERHKGKHPGKKPCEVSCGEPVLAQYATDEIRNGRYDRSHIRTEDILFEIHLYFPGYEIGISEEGGGKVGYGRPDGDSDDPPVSDENDAEDEVRDRLGATADSADLVLVQPLK